MSDTTKKPTVSTQPVARATLADVARAAGVDKSTASRALRDDESIGEVTRQRVQQVAQHLNYVPNASAQRLSNAQTHVIALGAYVLHGAATNPFLVELLAQITRAAAEHHYDVLLACPDPEANNLRGYERILGGHHADGLILMDLGPQDPRLDYLCARGYPHVLFGRSDEDIPRARRYPFPWVEVDNRHGARIGMEHLIQLGHRRIAFIGGENSYFCGQDRHDGYRDALNAAKIPFDPALFQPSEVNEEAGYAIAHQLLALPDPPTAIFAFSDLLAVGAMRAARDAGFHIGRDIAIIGFDGLGLGNYLIPQLTTLRQPLATIGHALVEYLIRQIRGESTGERHLLLEPELVVRASTAGP